MGSKYKVRAQTRPLTMAAVAFRRTGARCAGSFSKSSLDLGGSSSSTFRKAVQDMPPSGGYPQVIHKYTPTIRGPSGAVIWGVSTVLIMFGFYRVGQTNIARRQEKQATRE